MKKSKSVWTDLYRMVGLCSVAGIVILTGCIPIETGEENQLGEPVGCMVDRPDPGGCVVLNSIAAFDGAGDLDEACYTIHDTYTVEERTLNVSPGTTLYFGEDAGIRVLDSGALSAVGTSNDPICMYGLEEQRGYWRGLRFLNSPSADNRLDHVVLEHAGSRTWTTNRQARNHGGVVVIGDDVQLTVSNATFQNNQRPAIIATDSPQSGLTVTSSIFRNNEMALQIQAENVRNISEDTVIEDNDVPGLVLFSAAGDNHHVVTDATWPAFSFPYRVKSFFTVAQGSHLEIAPGARFEFEEGAGIRVAGATMAAVGEADAPIVFEGTEPVAGHWRGIYFTSTSSDRNRLRHVEVHHGGGHQWHHGRETSQGNIVLSDNNPTCNAENMALVEISNALITHSAQFGIAIRRGHNVTGCGEIEFQNIANDNIHDRNTELSGGGGCFCESGCDCG